MAEGRFSSVVNIRNKQAAFEYELLDRYVAGIMLKGTEIKSVREGKVNLTDGHVYFHNDEAFVKGMSISPFTEGTHYNHEAARERKLLLKKAELRRLKARSEEKGLTIVPIRLFINDRGFAKLEIALARGKKLRDKRESIREREARRELHRTKY